AEIEIRKQEFPKPVNCRLAVLDVRFGSEADMCAAMRHVRFTPNSDRAKSDASSKTADVVVLIGLADGGPMGGQVAAAGFAESVAFNAAEVIEARAPKVEPIDPKFLITSSSVRSHCSGSAAGLWVLPNNRRRGCRGA